MGTLGRWLTRNWADTAEGGDPVIVPRRLTPPASEAVTRVSEVITSLPRWQVEATDPDAGTLRATHQTRLFRFVDDVALRVESDGSGGSILHARSQSRVGKGDFGQNRRNLLELFAALGRVGLLREGDG
jgi:uncharacterized protein (DUF1499 family)